MEESIDKTARRNMQAKEMAKSALLSRACKDSLECAKIAVNYSTSFFIGPSYVELLA